MNPTVEAEQNLQIIRSLLERATVHRAVSSATAFVGGVLSVVLALVQTLLEVESTSDFLWQWAVVLALTAGANGWFLLLSARRRGGPYFSRGFKLSAKTTAPCLLTGALLSIAFSGQWTSDFAAFWIIFYGLALISTLAYAPRSILVLGYAFLFCGLLSAIYWRLLGTESPAPLATGSLLMGLTFGLFHLLYAAFTWPRKGGFLAALDPHPEHP